ncbi:MAG: phosphohydrolase [Spirochaetes bacterium]|nr:phosphohydrolase [Spirochaetota bacterium]
MENAASAGGSPASRDLYEASFTALDRYWGLRSCPVLFAAFPGELGEAAARFDRIEYAGLSYADFSTDAPLPTGLERDDAAIIRAVCAETIAPGRLRTPRRSYPQLELLYDPARRAYKLDEESYPYLRASTATPDTSAPEDLLFDTAVMLSRYRYAISGADAEAPAGLPVDYQRDLLVLILTGNDPERAFDYLDRTGFLDRYWPEIAGLRGVDHSKDFHPEGDVWRHTMETFRYRKLPDLRLSLGLLLHDSGKPIAVENEGRRFDRHSELGAGQARRFLDRLGFSRGIADDVEFLVLRHMMPAVVTRLPLARTRELMEHPLFPVLLELYRCDELSAFRGPDGYYRACATYRQFLRNAKNPYRCADGRKIFKQFLE